MYKNLRKKTAIVLTLLTAILLNNQPLRAEWAAGNYAEVATAVMRGLCSNIEYAIKNNDSNNAHITRLLISMIRITHGALAIHNHSSDYQSYYLYGLTAVDCTQGLTQCLTAFNEENLDTVHGNNNNEGSFFAEQANELVTSESITSSAVQNDTSIDERLEFVRKYALPAIESLGGILIAFTGHGDLLSQKALFTGQVLLTLSRTCQAYIDQEKGNLKNILEAIALINDVYSTYQLLFNDSDLNTWVKDERERRESDQKAKKDKHQREQMEKQEADAQLMRELGYW